MPFKGILSLLTVLVVGYILPVSEGTTGCTVDGREGNGHDQGTCEDGHYCWPSGKCDDYYYRYIPGFRNLEFSVLDHGNHLYDNHFSPWQDGWKWLNECKNNCSKNPLCQSFTYHRDKKYILCKFYDKKLTGCEKQKIDLTKFEQTFYKHNWTCMSTSIDSDICLQNQPKWGVDPLYTCKNSKHLCNDWAKDMRRCCPETCQNDQIFTESVCNESQFSNSSGQCSYPFDTIEGECGMIDEPDIDEFVPDHESRYLLSEIGSHCGDIPGRSNVRNMFECRMAVSSIEKVLNVSVETRVINRRSCESPDLPKGCIFFDNTVFWNHHHLGNLNGKAQHVCKIDAPNCKGDEECSIGRVCMDEVCKDIPKKCRANVGFLVDKTQSLQQEGWQTMKDFVLLLSKSFGIAEDGVHVALATFDSNASLEIKFSDHENYSSFENAVGEMLMWNEISDKPEVSDAFKGFNVSLNEMFTIKNGMRREDPNVLLYMTDGKCSRKEGECSDEEFRQWRNRFQDKNVTALGIGFGDEKAYKNDMEIFVGYNYFHQSNVNHILSAWYYFCDGAEMTTMTPNPEISVPATTDESDTNPGIECCNYFKVDQECFPLCKQLDIPVKNTEESSRDMTCKKFSGVINECRNGSSGWKLDNCCEKYDVSNRCRPWVCRGECKNKPWEIIGKLTGDEECNKYVDDVSRCCGPN